MERVTGIEPVSSAWKADIISHYTIPADIWIIISKITIMARATMPYS